MKATMILMAFAIILATIDQYESTPLGDFTGINIDTGDSGRPIGEKIASAMSQFGHNFRDSLVGCPDQNNGMQARCWWNKLREYFE